MSDLHEVSLYDEEGGKQSNSNNSRPPKEQSQEEATTAAAVDPTYAKARMVLLILSVLYIAILVAFMTWILRSTFEGFEFILIFFWMIPVGIVELILAITCTILTTKRWQQHAWYMKIVGLIPILSLVAYLLWVVITILVNMKDLNGDSAGAYMPPSCDPQQVCQTINATRFPVSWPKNCYFPDVFPEQDCYNSTAVENIPSWRNISWPETLESCNITDICSGLLF